MQAIMHAAPPTRSIARMSITPPDPGNAIKLAKDNDHDATQLGFRSASGELRWLWPEGARAWVATSSRERTVSADTYTLLRAGSQSERQIGTAFFTSGTSTNQKTYVLVDTGFEARADLA